MKLILDLDTGIDDAMALAYAIGHPEAEVLGVTSVFGNTETKQTTINASAILKLLGREDIPVYEGALGPIDSDEPYVQEAASATFHGKNGIADVELPTGNNIQDESAVDFIIECAEKYGKDLKIVTTGPLTNLAEVYQKDPEVLWKVNQIVSMGGTLTVPGNVSAYAEANFNKDPRANNIMFSSGLPMTMVGLDVTLRTLLTENDIAPWKDGSEAAQKFFDIVTFYFQAYDSSYDELAGCALHDPLAVSVALNPDIVSGVHFNLKSLEDEEQYGRIVQDQAAANAGKEKNVRVALFVDGESYSQHFVETINKAF